jgi:tetratricopeptide (TPR) repeat protein
MCARVQVFLQLCEQHLGGEERVYKDPEDHYYRAVILSNRGRFNRAVHHLEEALKMVRRRKKPTLQEDHIQYVLASTHALAGKPEEALMSLCEAVRLNPRNRILALNAPDFQALRADGSLEQALADEGLE